MRRAIQYILCVLFVLTLTVKTKGQNGDHLLWKVSSDPGQPVSYIYGTIHLKDARVFCFTDTLDFFIGETEKFIPELDLNSVNIMQLYQAMILPGDSTIKDLFTEDEFYVIKNNLEKETGLSVDMFLRFKPFVILSLLMNAQGTEDMSQSLDEYLLSIAGNLEKPVTGLETIEEQIELAEQITADYVLEFIGELGENEELLNDKMITIYREQHLDELLKLIQEDRSAINMQEAFITDRNYKMVNRLDTIIESQSAFIAIGAGHLPGDEGILNLLSKKGYHLEGIDISCKK